MYPNSPSDRPSDNIASAIGTACARLEDSCVSFLIPVLQDLEAARQRARERAEEVERGEVLVRQQQPPDEVLINLKLSKKCWFRQRDGGNLYMLKVGQ